MDENHIGPNINTILVQTPVRDGPYPVILIKPCFCHGKVQVQFVGQAIFVLIDRICDTMGIFYFWFLLVFCALILSPLLGNPENAGVM